MKPSKDLRDIFLEWGYDEDDNVRFLTGVDGRDIMQIRQPLGIEQYDLDGRPDGLKPEGAVNFLEMYLREEAAADENSPLALKDEDFLRLQNEGILYYQRYLALFQVGHYDRVARDSRHNLNICSLLERRYSGDQRFEILQYWPYILRMNAISRAMLKLADEESGAAMNELQKGCSEIEALPLIPTPVFEFEKIRSLQHLAQVINQVKEDLTENEGTAETDLKGFRERLSEELGQAVDNEDYERAARLRDRLHDLG